MAWSWAAMINPSLSDLCPSVLFDGPYLSRLLFLGITHALVYLPIFVSINLGNGALLFV